MEKFNKWTQLFDCKELNAIQLRVLLLILNYHNIDNWDNTSLKKLKTDSGASINTVAKSVNELEEKGLIKTVISSYKKSFKPTYDYLPQYEAIQKLINDNHISKIDKCNKKDISKIDKCNKKDISKIDNHISNNDTNIYQKMTEHISKIDNKYNTINKTINKTKEIEKENRKEKPENPVNGNPETISIFDSDFRDFKDSPNNQQKEKENTENPVCDSPKSNSDSKSKPYRVNLNYIDDLERQFNGYTDATSPNAAENSPKATANPKTTETQTPKTGGKYLSANPNLTSDYIKSLSCIFTENNPTILLDLVEASKRTALVMDALDKAIEWIQRHKDCKNKDMEYIAKVYINASQITTPSMQRILEILRAEIIKNGGREMIQSA